MVIEICINLFCFVFVILLCILFKQRGCTYLRATYNAKPVFSMKLTLEFLEAGFDVKLVVRDGNN